MSLASGFSVTPSATQKYPPYHHGCPPAPSEFPCDCTEHASTVYPSDSCSQASHSTTRSRTTSKAGTKATRSSSKKKTKQPKTEVPPLPSSSQASWAPPSSYRGPAPATTRIYLRNSLPPIVEHEPSPQGLPTSPSVIYSTNALAMTPYHAPPPQSSIGTDINGVGGPTLWDLSPYRGHYDAQRLQLSSQWPGGFVNPHQNGRAPFAEPPVYPDSQPDVIKERRVYEHVSSDGTVLRSWDDRTVMYRPS